jgi:hypothetical protein
MSFLRYDLWYEALTWRTDLCVSGDVNDGGINSLQMCSTLHWPAKQGAIAANVSNGQTFRSLP